MSTLLLNLEAELAADHALVAMSALMTYDYLLNLDSEIRLIWSSKVSLMTVSYGMLRYIGMLWAASALAASLNVTLTSKTCLAMNAVYNACEMTILFLLQGIMTLRVYTLYGNSRKLIAVLLPCFIVSQGIFIGSTIRILAVGPSVETEGTILGVNACIALIPVSLYWVPPLQFSVVTGFEVLLCAAALHYTYKHVKASEWRSPARLLGRLVALTVRDNLIYFAIAFFSLIVSSMDQNGVFATYTSPAYMIVESILEFFLMTMVGPWMILSIRRNAETMIHGGSEATELTTVRFLQAEVVRDNNTTTDSEWGA